MVGAALLKSRDPPAVALSVTAPDGWLNVREFRAKTVGLEKSFDAVYVPAGPKVSVVALLPPAGGAVPPQFPGTDQLPPAAFVQVNWAWLGATDNKSIAAQRAKYRSHRLARSSIESAPPENDAQKTSSCEDRVYEFVQRKPLKNIHL
jgi:hypothetical protein